MSHHSSRYGLHNAHLRSSLVPACSIAESRIDATPLDELAKIRDNYFIRLEAIEDVELRPNKREPEMWIGVTGSEHHLFFPYAAEDEVRAFQRALSKEIGLR